MRQHQLKLRSDETTKGTDKRWKKSKSAEACGRFYLQRTHRCSDREKVPYKRRNQ